MDKNSLFDKNLVYLDEVFDTSEEFLKYIGQILENTTLTKGGFTKALLEREKMYPTALPSVPFPVAIPHCDPDYIKEERIVCVRFKKPVRFTEMGTEDKNIDVHFAFVLLIKEKKQVSVLQTLMPIFMNDLFMRSLKEIDDKEKFIEKMEDKFYERKS